MKQRRGRAERAKLFMPFAALKGYGDYIKEKERVIVPKADLMPDAHYTLDWKIKMIESGKLITVVYYDRNQYVKKEGMVSDISLEKGYLKIVDTIINLIDIVSIESKELDFE